MVARARPPSDRNPSVAKEIAVFMSIFTGEVRGPRTFNPQIRRRSDSAAVRFRPCLGLSVIGLLPFAVVSRRSSRRHLAEFASKLRDLGCLGRAGDCCGGRGRRQRARVAGEPTPTMDVHGL